MPQTSIELYKSIRKFHECPYLFFFPLQICIFKKRHQRPLFIMVLVEGNYRHCTQTRLIVSGLKISPFQYKGNQFVHINLLKDTETPIGQGNDTKWAYHRKSCQIISWPLRTAWYTWWACFQMLKLFRFSESKSMAVTDPGNWPSSGGCIVLLDWGAAMSVTCTSALYSQNLMKGQYSRLQCSAAADSFANIQPCDRPLPSIFYIKSIIQFSWVCTLLMAGWGFGSLILWTQDTCLGDPP